MAERDDIIKAWTLCAYDPEPSMESKHMHSCIECPYYVVDGEWEECQFGKLINDTIAKLQEDQQQNDSKTAYIKDLLGRVKRLEEAHLITKDDFADADEEGYITCWLEMRKDEFSKSELCVDILDRAAWYKRDPWYSRWWSKKPTDQQRKNTKWMRGVKVL